MVLNNQTISFVLDGKITEIDFNKSALRPTQTLLHYLRSLPGHKGTKEGCGEGDCGACTVVIAEVVKDKLIYKAVDSCLVFLPMVHGKQVITIENLSIPKNGQSILHPIQQAIVEENGTQCGFCTPGFVMSIFALTKSQKNPSKDTILNTLAGNLCRCTGYQSIINATRKASKITIPDQFSNNEPKIIKLLSKIKCNETIRINTGDQVFLKPFSIEELLKLKAQYPDALIVSGSTDCGLRVTKKHEILPFIIDISDVNALKTIKKTADYWHIGAATKLEEIRAKVKSDLVALYQMLTVFGSKQIRNMATIGGNVGSASPIGDTLPLLLAYKACVVLSNTKGSRTIPLSDFIVDYRKTLLEKDEIISSVIIPRPEKDVIIKSYKVSKRKDLDISTVSACFSLKLKNNKVSEIIMVYGGMSAYTKRAIQAEQFLKNKVLSEKIIIEAAAYIENDFSPISDARAGKKMRMTAAKNLLMKFYIEEVS